MTSLLAWQSLVFTIPVGFGALLALGAAFGLGVGVGHDGHGFWGAGPGDDTLAVLGVGRLPLTLRLMVLSLAFGGAGLVLSPLVSQLVSSANVAGAIEAGLALASAAVVDRRAARLVARRMPLLESETVSRAELVGATGHVVLTVSSSGGLAHVLDRRGNLHQVACRVAAGEASVPAGAEILLVEHDDARNLYFVSPAP
jgi:hypothetical protein